MPQNFAHFVPDEQPQPQYTNFVPDEGSGAASANASAPEGTTAKFQRAFDELATPPKFDIHHPISTGAQDFGAGVIGMLSPIFHPKQTLDAATKLALGSTADKMSVLRPMAEQFEENPAGQGIAAVPGLASMLSGAGVEGAARDIGEATERGGLNLGNAALGARGPKPFKYGANPARGAFEEGVLPAMSKHSASMKLEHALPQAGAKVSNAVMGGNIVPSSKIAQSIEAPINEANDIMSGFGGGRSVDPVADLWTSMEAKAPDAATSIYGKNAPANIPAHDLWRSIQNLDKNTRFNPDPEVEGVNELRRDIRGGLRGNLEEAVPGLKPISRRYGDLKSAEEVLDRTMHTGSGLAKLAKVPTFPIESGIGKLMYSGGRGMSAAAPFAGRMAAASGPVATLMNDIRKNKEK